MARENGCLILEDEAHALYTDLVDGRSGRRGDAVIFSLHKMLPFKDGGALGLNNTAWAPKPGRESALDKIFGYDLWSIARKRKENVRALCELIPNIDGVKPLWDMNEMVESLQTFPIIVEDVDRNELYQKMNDEGFGVVSLYHTLIPEITPERYPDSHALARKIMNLPVHQDANRETLTDMCKKLHEIICHLRKR